MVLSAERRSLLVRTAAREFARVGFEQASLNAVIRDCGLSKSSFYHVLDSKAALYELVIDDIARDLAAALDAPEPAAFAGPEFWQRVEEFIGRLAEVLASDEAFTQLAHMIYDRRPPRDDGAGARVTQTAQAWVGELVAVGRDCGAVRADLPESLQGALAVAVLRAMDEWSVAHLDEIPAAAMPALLAAQFAALRRLLDA
ncbi:DNA-binding transcriptional regulator, AcrR family [Paramicrobacterium humi]|uniref:DNA-binding transcriptional regulator, AcrR family n=1 Tax=Paramicrobacterium humi TaxID=640635 RepID=A0A1H4T347_9MICO|nr:TetR/AcrR family transcriptional regulator [Microbacterium humi]SEC50708.1 DNA-binding transcriptional regulator, AcrR family [Microbacterium humi]